MSADVVNVPTRAERGARTKSAQNLRLVEIEPKLRDSNGLQPRPENIV